MHVGNLGYSWSFAGSGTGSVFLGFNAQYLTPVGAGHRGYGLQLRCLSE
ncbi:hypothetical protein [uncultured Rikenella sp.]|nr:hypothetical protein [uncultured Rikenella sp.]